MFINAVTISVVLYVLIGYLSYVTASILYEGFRYKLPLTIIRSLSFIGISYTSIISDILLFSAAMYSSVFVKNALLLALIVTSLLPTTTGKEEEDADTGE